MALIQVSGTLTIDIEGLEEEIQKIEALKSKISATIRKMLDRVNKVAAADNWPDLQEGSEQLKKIYQAALNRIESKADRVKAEINKVLDQIKQNESKVQSKFGELLVKAGQAIKGKTDTKGKNDAYWALTDDDLNEIRKMSYQEKVDYLNSYYKSLEEYGPGGAPSTLQKVEAIENSFTPLQKALYIRNKKTTGVSDLIKYTSTGSIKNLFNSKSSILTDIKNRGNDIFLKIFGNNK